MRAAVVGAGPAGFYTAQALLKRFPTCTVDLLERLPVPFGLVRYGVSPDHPATKYVINHFSAFVSQNRHRVNFYGNVNVAPDAPVTPALLRTLYDLTIYATGAARPRALDIPVPPHRVHSAHHFAYWVNGHPDVYAPAPGGSLAERIEADLAGADDVAVVGVGNVAIDVARMLLRPVDDLRDTDIAPSALDVLSQSKVSSVTLIGRKNPLRAAWTTAALREVVAKIPGIVTACDHSLVKQDLAQPNIPRARASTLKLLSEKTLDFSAGELSAAERVQKLLRLEFLTTPTGFDLTDNCVQLQVRRNRSLQSSSPPDSKPLETALTETSNHDLVFLSLGYVGGTGKPGAVGWANGTARGIIGDNKWDAESFVAQVPIPESLLPAGSPTLQNWIIASNCEVVTWDGWQRIDLEEKRRVTTKTGPGQRVKITQTEELLRVANGPSPTTAYNIPTVAQTLPIQR